MIERPKWDSAFRSGSGCGTASGMGEDLISEDRLRREGFLTRTPSDTSAAASAQRSGENDALWQILAFQSWTSNLA